MKIIPLTQNQEALVDDELFDYLNQWKWHATKSTSKKRWKGNYYVARTIKTDRGQRLLKMHHQIWWKLHPETEGQVILIDHKDSNGLNNQVSNLRHASTLQNNRNSHKPQRACTSQYKGVRRISYHGKRGDSYYWMASIAAGPLLPNGKHKDINLGRFKTDIDAAKAYDAAAQQYFGDFSCLNFKPLNQCSNYISKCINGSGRVYGLPKFAPLFGCSVGDHCRHGSPITAVCVA